MAWLFLFLVLWNTGCSRGCEKEKAKGSPERALQPVTPQGCSTDGESTGSVRFGFTPKIGGFATLEQYDETTPFLSRSIEAPVDAVHADDYADLTNRLDQGEVDVASLTSMTYVNASRRIPCLKLLATQVVGGDFHYSAYLLVRKDSEITTVEQLRGRRIAFVSRPSASGFLLPMAHLVRSGMKGDEVSANSVTFKTHPDVVRAVIEGRADAGATFRGAFRAIREKGIDTGSLRVLAITGRIPFDTIVARPGLSDELATRIREAFLSLNSTTTEGRSALGHRPELNGWIQTSDHLYEELREDQKFVLSMLGEPLP